MQLGFSARRTFLKYLILNALITMGLIAIVDVVVTMQYFQRHAVNYKKNDKLTCSAVLTGYDYCRSLTQFNFMDKRDRLFPVSNFIDANRRSIYGNPEKIPLVTRKERIYILGDSFVQADELSMEERFEHFLREDGFDVSAFGYSSWNSWQFGRISSSLTVNSGDHVFIFSMVNDYTPAYYASTVKTLEKFRDVRDEDVSVPKRSLLADYMRQSFFANRIFPGLLSIWEGMGKQRIESRDVSALYPSNAPTCESIADNKAMVDSGEMLEYLLLSQDQVCWSPELHESVALNVTMLRNIKTALESRGAAVHILLVPAGWAFKNQNTIGRIVSPYYFPSGVEVGQDGLVAYAKAKGLMLDDLRYPLSKSDQGDNSLYFAVDGHWTSHAHRIVYKYLKDTYLQ